jgi:hypothetical protein
MPEEDVDNTAANGAEENEASDETSEANETNTALDKEIDEMLASLNESEDEESADDDESGDDDDD